MEDKDMAVIETERLTLRRFEMSDAEAMFRNWASDPEVVRFMAFDRCDTLEETRKRIDEWQQYFCKKASDSWALFAIVLKPGGEVIGMIDFAETEPKARSAEVGYQLGKAWWGNGYAAEALRALIKYCFETIGLNRVWARYDIRNVHSGRVMQKVGMRYEGTFRQCKLCKGELVSHTQYAILAEEVFLQKKDS